MPAPQGVHKTLMIERSHRGAETGSPLISVIKSSFITVLNESLKVPVH